MINKYSISFWNYESLGKHDSAQATEDWVDLGITKPLSFKFNSAVNTKEEMLSHLDDIYRRGMRCFVNDIRTDFHTLKAKGLEEYLMGAQQTVSDFGHHPAVLGFCIGDEPKKEEFPIAEQAFLIMKELAPHLEPFINFFPIFLDSSFSQIVCHDEKEYEELLDEFMKHTGAHILSYDCYAQGSYYEREYYVNLYFRNLNLFQRVAQRYNAVLHTSLLSVGHWNYVVPNEDLFRWQISTAIAHGVKGLWWFYMYTHDGENYRLAPYDEFGKKTQTYDSMSRQNKLFLKKFAEKLDKLTFKSVGHHGKVYGTSEVFCENKEIVKIDFPAESRQPLIFTRFEDENGNPSYLVVNLSQTLPTCVDIECGGDLVSCTKRYRFAPGQMVLIENPKTFPKPLAQEQGLVIT